MPSSQGENTSLVVLPHRVRIPALLFCKSPLMCKSLQAIPLPASHLCQLPRAFPEEHDANVGGRCRVGPDLQSIITSGISLQQNTFGYMSCEVAGVNACCIELLEVKQLHRNMQSFI